MSGMAQNNISRMESPDYGKHSISSLKRIADALDVALMVRFVPFSQYTDWLSGTPHLDQGIRPEALAVPSFTAEEKAGVFATNVRYHPVYTTATVIPQRVSGVTDPVSAVPRQGAIVPMRNASQKVLGYVVVPGTPELNFERAG